METHKECKRHFNEALKWFKNVSLKASSSSFYLYGGLHCTPPNSLIDSKTWFILIPVLLEGRRNRQTSQEPWSSCSRFLRKSKYLATGKDEEKQDQTGIGALVGMRTERVSWAQMLGVLGYQPGCGRPQGAQSSSWENDPGSSQLEAADVDWQVLCVAHRAQAHRAHSDRGKLSNLC